MKNFIFTVMILAINSTANAGAIEDILKLESELKSNDKAVICKALKTELKNAIDKKQKLLTVIEKSTGDKLKNAQNSFSEWAKVQTILDDQIKQNACGGVK